MRVDFKNPTAQPVTPGKTLFLLGQSLDGPVHTPVRVSNMAEAKTVFKEGNLLEAYAQAMKTEGIDIYLMRISGEYARLSLLGNLEGKEIPLIKFRSVSGGETYNSVHIYIGSVKRDGTEEEALIIEHPFASYGKSYILRDYPNLNGLVFDINKDVKRGGVVYAATEFPMYHVSELRMLNQTPRPLKGGSDGVHLTKDELYIALEEAYELLEGREIDAICPYPARLDDAHPAFFYDTAAYGKAAFGTDDYLALLDPVDKSRIVTFHEQLIRFCEKQEGFGFMTHGIIGLREVKDIAQKQIFYLSRLLRASAFGSRYGFVNYLNGTWSDNGYRISVFAQDFDFEVEGKTFGANGCAMYASMVAATGPQETTTNQTVPTHASLRFTLSPQEMRDLVRIGAVTARHSVKRGVVITNGLTAALPDTPFQNIANIRAVQYVLYSMNRVLEDQIGEPFNAAMTLKSISKRVDDGLKHLTTLSVIKEYAYNVNFDEASQSVQVELKLKPRYSTEFVETKALMKFSNNGGV